MPERIQLRRTKGWRKPEGAIVVARPSRWGNPFKLRTLDDGRCDVVTDLFLGRRLVETYPTQSDAAEAACSLFRDYLTDGFMGPPDAIADQLAGHDLACWCPLDQPCHADVLLELANDPSRVAEDDAPPASP